ncbi:MAG: hypothetical protein RIR70_1656, partial [Pseudomonadota bacterium]
ALAHSLGTTARAAVRVNPDFQLKGAGMRMGGGAKAFGVDAEAVPALLHKMANLPVRFEGFHLYSGSQNLSGPALAQSQLKSLSLALDLAGQAGMAPSVINLGGGFGIPYFEGDGPLDLAPIHDALIACRKQLSAAYPGCKLVLELGRYLVGEAGAYVCRVIRRKVSRGAVFLVTDGGLHHHLAASGNFGQTVRRNYPLCLANRMSQPRDDVVNVVGPLCTPLDVLAREIKLPIASAGDLIAVLQSGAYGLTASPNAFLSHPAAREVLV